MIVRFTIIGLSFALCASSIVAGESMAAEKIQVAKFSAEDPLQTKKPQIAMEVNERYEYYDIDGATAGDLQSQMRRNGTKWDDGKTYAALATWDIRYRYDIKQENGKYWVKSGKTELDVLYRFPRWAKASTGPEKLSGQWSSYMDHLREHEFGHRDIAVKTVTEINEALASAGSFNSSRELDRQVNKIIQAKLDHLKQAQKDYDAETHHGKTQGAIFP